jgi:hypothetical protein
MKRTGSCDLAKLLNSALPNLSIGHGITNSTIQGRTDPRGDDNGHLTKRSE